MLRHCRRGRSLGFSEHEVGAHLRGWEALVDELEVIVVELLVVLKVVFFASKEFIDLGQPGAV